MSTITLYAGRSDMLSSLSLDSLARLTNDPLRRSAVGVGDGSARRFVTPFIETTSFKGYVSGVEVTPAPTLSRASGSSGRDEVVFDAAPALNAVVAVTADKDALNADVIDRALLWATQEIESYLHAYRLPITDEVALGILRGKAVVLAQMRLRGRRSLDVADPLDLEWKAVIRWLEAVGRGVILLPTSVTYSRTEVRASSEPEAFGPLPGNVADEGDLWA